MAAPEEPIVIPVEAITSEALRNVIEEFVTRDGTDYGRSERSLEDKVRDVMRQLRRGEAKIVFDPDTETVNVVTAR